MASNLIGERPEGLEKKFKDFITKALDAHAPLDTLVKACLDSKYSNIYRHVCDHGGERYAKQTIADVLNKPVELIWPHRDVAINGGGDPKIDFSPSSEAPDRATVRSFSIEMEEPDFEAFAAMEPLDFVERASDLPPAPFTRVTYEDFFSYMVEHRYIFVPTGDLWPAASVNARLPKKPLIVDGKIVVKGKDGDGEDVDP